LNVTRSDVLRMALRKGLDALAAEDKIEKRRR
jgi:DNA-binding GntR family transcriptional regulator